MTEPEGDAALFARLETTWEQRWPGVLPALDARKPTDRWVRFHSLPGSKRYADTDEEHAEILRRHHAVLVDLMRDSVTDLLVICADWGERDLAHGWHRSILPTARYWTSVQSDPEEGTLAMLYVDTSFESLASLDALLRAVADDATGPVLLTPATFEWRYQPYDGGADVIARSIEERDRLAAGFAAWLSAREDGL